MVNTRTGTSEVLCCKGLSKHSNIAFTSIVKYHAAPLFFCFLINAVMFLHIKRKSHGNSVK